MGEGREWGSGVGFGSSTSLPGKIKSPDVILAIPNGGLKYFSGTVYRGGLKNFLKFSTAKVPKATTLLDLQRRKEPESRCERPAVHLWFSETKKIHNYYSDLLRLQTPSWRSAMSELSGGSKEGK